jgi:hypothetical protein
MKLQFIFIVVVFILFTMTFCSNTIASEDPVAWWKFDKMKGRSTLDTISGNQDEILGFFKYVPGVQGEALLFDGYTTGIRRLAHHAPVLRESFSIEAWVAFQAYPWGLCAIVGQTEVNDVPFARRTNEIPFPAEPDPPAGYYFAVDAMGRVHFQAFIDGEWKKCKSEERIPLLEWAHIAATYDKYDGLAVYINGKISGTAAVSGSVRFYSGQDVLIGKNNSKRRLENPVGSIIPSVYSFDGYIDEVKIYDYTLSADEISKKYHDLKPSSGTGMTYRQLPTEPAGPATFGAYYTQLSFDESWDMLRREGPHSDIVVLFDEKPWRFLFWRGTGYVPFWVTENNIWYTNEFNETWPPVNEPNVFEPMSDKQAHTSHVRIIESTDARVVIHWRYALVNTLYNIAWEDTLSGWGDWADEYNYIYPDGFAVRKQTIWSSRLDVPHEFQESIILNPPGTKPEDNLELDAVTIVNMKGEKYTHSWADGPKALKERTTVGQLAEKSYPNIQLVNTKSKAKPVLIVPDHPFVATYPTEGPVDGALHMPWTWMDYPDHSKFPWWNHWPVAQIPSDGRFATGPDRVSHTALTNWLWAEYERTEYTQVKLSLQGLTEKAPEDLVPLAKSWLEAPGIHKKSPGFETMGYDQAERAYIIHIFEKNNPSTIKFRLGANPEHPLVNPAFVITDWGEAGLDLKIDGKSLKRGKNFRYGHRNTPHGKDLIVWLKLEGTKALEMELSPK